MNVDIARSFFLWCTVINYAILMVWFLTIAFARAWLHRLHGRWFHLSDEPFDALHYGAMAVYKVGILLFNLVPLIALWIVG